VGEATKVRRFMQLLFTYIAQGGGRDGLRKVGPDIGGSAFHSFFAQRFFEVF
jgi:hypothetical protein